MNSVFRCENYRLRRSKEVKIILLAMLVLQFFTIALNFALNHMSFFKQFMASAGIDETEKAGFFDGFGRLAVNGAFVILLLVTICSLITKLYQHGITKQLVSSGIPRGSIILGQFFSFALIYSVIAILLSITSGVSNIIQGGSFNIGQINIRFVLLIFAILLVIFNQVSIYLLIAHLTTTMGGAILLGLIVNMGLSTAIFSISLMTKWDWINTYFFGNLQSAVITVEGSVKEQLIGMGILCVYTIVFLIITQIIFKHKDIK